jgi:NADH:quinone reductase (non-electrogenic)
VGGGFGGLYAAQALAHVPVHITLLDRQNHHLFQPMLYQVATAALASNEIATPIRSVLRQQANAEVQLAEVTAVHTDARTVLMSDGSSISYDYLILAPGVRHSYFGHDEWEALAPGLKSLEDAEEIRRRVLLAFERAEREKDPVRRHANLTFVVVGGGPTGVEVAGALAEVRRYALRRDFRHIDPRDATVMLLEGGPRILPSYPPELSLRAKNELRRLGVEVREHALVTDVRPGLVVAAGWTIPTQTIVWAAGNQASPLTRTLGAPLDHQGRVLVEPDCTVPGHPEVFVLGDAVAYPNGKGGTLPGVSPVAIQMGRYAADCIAGDLVGRPRRPFNYWDKGQLAVIGRGHAVADIWRLRFAGLLAWLIWIFVHIFFLIGFRNRMVVIFEWAWAYFTYERGARLITQANPEYDRHTPPYGLPVPPPPAAPAPRREPEASGVGTRQ